MVRYHLNQNSTKTKSSKSCRSGKPSLVLDGAMILCLQFADLSMTFWFNVKMGGGGCLKEEGGRVGSEGGRGWGGRKLRALHTLQFHNV